LRENGLSRLMIVYRRTISNRKNVFITSENGLHLPALRDFLQGLLDSPQDRKYQKLTKELHEIEEYYQEKFPEFQQATTNANANAKIQNLCHSYFQGLYWIYYYYFQGCASWKWQFGHRWAPAVKDLLSYLNDIIASQIRQETQKKNESSY